MLGPTEEGVRAPHREGPGTEQTPRRQDVRAVRGPAAPGQAVPHLPPSAWDPKDHWPLHRAQMAPQAVGATDGAVMETVPHFLLQRRLCPDPLFPMP